MYHIEFNANVTYDMPEKPTLEEIDSFIECFISDIIDGNITILPEIWKDDEKE